MHPSLYQCSHTIHHLHVIHEVTSHGYMSHTVLCCQATRKAVPHRSGNRRRSLCASAGGLHRITHAMFAVRPIIVRVLDVCDSHRCQNLCIHHTLRIPMKNVPALVMDEGGRPLHHGSVERSYDRLRQIIQMYVLDKQEDRVCV